jgi:ABC-type bacteriocin/lantibiotic exporter with double-glycine peptidase domain
LSNKFQKSISSGWKKSLFGLFLFLFLWSCAAFPPAVDQKSAKMIPAVPFFPQEIYQCGPASLAGVLNYWKVSVTPEEIAQAIYSPSARGTLDIDMVFYGERKGLKAVQYAGSKEDIKKNVDGRIPLIVLVDEGFLVYQKHHFMVIVGYGEEGLLANSGREQNRFYTWPDFLKTWGKTKNWTLRLTPQ